MKVILKSDEVGHAIHDLADRILLECGSDADIAVIGLRSRGEVIAERIAGRLSAKLGREIPQGVLDITLYRDDLNEPGRDNHPAVRSTEIPFDVDDRTVILVDDVLYTGRSVRAAMDALTDLGRPRAIKLAVLVDRGHRELPIQADFCACRVDVSPQQSVEVSLAETDQKDEVIIQ